MYGIGKKVYNGVKENKKMYRKIAVLMEFIVIVFVVFTQYEYWLTQPTWEMEEIQNAEYNLKLTAKDLKEGQYEKIVDTTKFQTVEDSSIVKETGLDIVNTKYTKEFSEWSGYTTGKEGYTSIYAVGKDQYNKYIKQLGLSYDDMKDKAILCQLPRP